MTKTDWILDIALILVVLRQIRWSRIDPFFLLVPIGITSFVAYTYLDPIPTGGNDLLLISAFAVLGIVLGVTGGLTTHVRVREGKAFVRAGFAAASLWVLGMGARLAFAVWSEHSGGPTIVRFSERHDITSMQAWVSGLILMVLCEVGTRIGTILVRVAAAKRQAAVGSGGVVGVAEGSAGLERGCAGRRRFRGRAARGPSGFRPVGTPGRGRAQVAGAAVW
jgi:hypothetical protein